MMPLFVNGRQNLAFGKLKLGIDPEGALHSTEITARCYITREVFTLVFHIEWCEDVLDFE
jgi:hypothetical protein